MKSRAHCRVAEARITVPLDRLEKLVDWMDREQEDLTCSMLCDKTFETQGCHGECALEAGRREIQWWKSLIAIRKK